MKQVKALEVHLCNLRESMFPVPNITFHCARKVVDSILLPIRNLTQL